MQAARLCYFVVRNLGAAHLADTEALKKAVASVNPSVPNLKKKTNRKLFILFVDFHQGNQLPVDDILEKLNFAPDSGERIMPLADARGLDASLKNHQPLQCFDKQVDAHVL